MITFRSQDDPHGVYLQDVMTHPGYRRRGMTKALLNALRPKAEGWGCRRGVRLDPAAARGLAERMIPSVVLTDLSVNPHGNVGHTRHTRGVLASNCSGIDEPTRFRVRRNPVPPIPI